MVLATNDIRLLPIDVLAHVLAYAVRTPPDLESVGAVARVLKEVRGRAQFKIRVENWRMSMESWNRIANEIARTAPKCISLHFQGCNLDHYAVDTFIRLLHNLSEISLSKCFGVQGGILMDRLRLNNSAQSRLRVAVLGDLPSVHSTLVVPALPNLVCLGLTNCNLEADNSSMATSNWRVPFFELFAGAVTTGCLPQLKHLFLGGAVLEPESTPGEGDEATGTVNSESTAAQQSESISSSGNIATSNGCNELNGLCPKLATLEVTFLPPLVVARVRRLLTKAISPSTAVLCLITTPLRDLQNAFGPIVKEFPRASQGVTEARNEQKASALHTWCLPIPPDGAAGSGVTGTTLNKQSSSNSIEGDERVLWLLKMGARPSLKDNRGATPLFRASERGASTTVIKALLRAGANAVNEVNHKCEGPLFISALKGQARVARILLESLGPQPLGASSQSPGVAAATTTTTSRSTATPAVLNPKSLNPFAAEWQPSISGGGIGLTPSARGGATAAQEAKRSLTAQTSDTEGFSPLHCAVLRRCETTLRALLEANCFDVEAQTKHGQTALHLALRSSVLLGRSSPHARTERAAAADRTASGGRTAATTSRSSIRESLRLVELLLNHGADANASDDSGSTPMDYCASSRDGSVNNEVEAILLQKGAVRNEQVHGGHLSGSKQQRNSRHKGHKGNNHRHGKKKGP